MRRAKGIVAAWLCALVLGVLALAVPVKAQAAEIEAEVSYQVRGANGVWSSQWTTDAGVIRPATGITGVRMRLDEASAVDRDVWYRARQADGTWLAWQCDGADLASADGSALGEMQMAVSEKGAGAPFAGDADTVSTVREPLTAQSVEWKRLWGAGRYDTMAKIVGEAFSSSDWVVVASGVKFPDALAASALAGARNCPVILTAPDELSAQALTKIKELGATHAYVMGGEGALSSTVVGTLVDNGVTPERVKGDTRVLTSVAALKKVREIDPGVTTLVVASGEGYADALSISPWAYANKAPIVLAQSDGTLSSETISAIQEQGGFTKAIAVGGGAVVKESVKDQLAAIGITQWERLGGEGRFDTSKRIAQWEISHGFTLASPIVASSKDFPDALAGGALGGKKHVVLLIASGLADATCAYLRDNAGAIAGGYLLGGTSAVPFDNPLAEPPAPVVLDDMGVLAQGFSSGTGWLILLNCTTNRLAVYTGSKGNWKQYDQWSVSTGAPWSPTVKGTFTVGGRGDAFGDGYSYVCHWWTRFYGDYLFHSVLYNFDGTVQDGRLGMNISHGCARMEIHRAKWIHDTIPDGTTVYSY